MSTWEFHKQGDVNGIQCRKWAESKECMDVEHVMYTFVKMGAIMPTISTFKINFKFFKFFLFSYLFLVHKTFLISPHENCLPPLRNFLVDL